MSTEELHKQYTQLLRGAPDVLTPSKIVRRTPFGNDFAEGYGYHIAKKSAKHKALLTAFFRQKN